jgi:excisionase family DNA binding protein
MSEHEIVAQEKGAVYRKLSRLTRSAKPVETVGDTYAPPSQINVAARREPMLTIPQVCEILALSRTSVWKLTSSGTLKCVRIGKSVRVRPSDLDACLAELGA